MVCISNMLQYFDGFIAKFVDTSSSIVSTTGQ